MSVEYTGGALLGGLLAGAAGFLRALQTPVGVGAALVAAGVGTLFGGGATVLVLWQYPGVPWFVACAAGAFVGYVSKQVSETAVRVTNVLLGRVEARYDPGAANVNRVPESETPPKQG